MPPAGDLSSITPPHARTAAQDHRSTRATRSVHRRAPRRLNRSNLHLAPSRLRATPFNLSPFRDTRYNRCQWRIRLVGLGHLPLKEEIGGSNPPCATKIHLCPNSERESRFHGLKIRLEYFANMRSISLFIHDMILTKRRMGSCRQMGYVCFGRELTHYANYRQIPYALPTGPRLSRLLSLLWLRG